MPGTGTTSELWSFASWAAATTRLRSSSAARGPCRQGSFKAHRAPALVDDVGLVGSMGAPRTARGPRDPDGVHERVRWPGVALLKYYSTDLDHLVVVHDELDIPSGVVRVKRGGGEGGHNGLRAVTKSLGSKDFLRVRVGIGRPPGRMDPADFVLRDFSAARRPNYR